MTRLGKVLMVLVAAAGIAAAVLVGKDTQREGPRSGLSASQLADMQPHKKEEPKSAPRISRTVEGESTVDGAADAPEDGSGS